MPNRLQLPGPFLGSVSRIATRPNLVLGTLLIAVMFTLAACDNPPRGQRAGRIGATDTDLAETKTGEILPAALIEFSDQVAQEMSRDIADVPRVRDTEGKVTVILGDIENKTQIVSTNDFEMMLHRMRVRLNNAPATKRKLRFVEKRARMSDIAQREGVANADGTAEPGLYDPQTTYVLNGNVYRVGRGPVNMYYMEVQLSHFGSNDIVKSFNYETKRKAN